MFDDTGGELLYHGDLQPPLSWPCDRGGSHRPARAAATLGQCWLNSSVREMAQPDTAK